jgi:hypothetical protein
MKEERFEIGKAPQLLVQCHGDLHIRGWIEPARAGCVGHRRSL